MAIRQPDVFFKQWTDNDWERTPPAIILRKLDILEDECNQYDAEVSRIDLSQCPKDYTQLFEEMRVLEKEAMDYLRKVIGIMRDFLKDVEEFKRSGGNEDSLQARVQKYESDIGKEAPQEKIFEQRTKTLRRRMASVFRKYGADDNAFAAEEKKKQEEQEKERAAKREEAQKREEAEQKKRDEEWKKREEAAAQRNAEIKRKREEEWQQQEAERAESRKKAEDSKRQWEEEQRQLATERSRLELEQRQQEIDAQKRRDEDDRRRQEESWKRQEEARKQQEEDNKRRMEEMKKRMDEQRRQAMERQIPQPPVHGGQPQSPQERPPAGFDRDAQGRIVPQVPRPLPRKDGDDAKTAADWYSEALEKLAVLRNRKYASPEERTQLSVEGRWAANQALWAVRRDGENRDSPYPVILEAMMYGVYGRFSGGFAVEMTLNSVSFRLRHSDPKGKALELVEGLQKLAEQAKDGEDFTAQLKDEWIETLKQNAPSAKK